MSEQLFGAPRPSRRAQSSVVAFGLIGLASLAVPALSDVAPMPGTTLLALGAMLMCGVAELIDRSLRRFGVALRFAGLSIMAFGFVIQLL